MTFWSWHVKHARGYRELGLLKQARAELDQVPLSARFELDVLNEEAALAQERKDWETLVKHGAELARRFPEEASGWILWAYGARRHESLEKAEKVLLEGLLRHPDEPTLHFNLGCYACKRGDLATAFRRVAKAIALEPKFKELAATDEDLEDLRRSGQFKT